MKINELSKRCLGQRIARNTFALVLIISPLTTVVAAETNSHTAIRPRAISASLRPFDLVFRSSKAGQGRLLQILTLHRYTHVGIIVPNYQRGKSLMVLEALATVRETPLLTWISVSNGRWMAKRLRDHTQLNNTAIAAMLKEGSRTLGKRYDSRFTWTDSDGIYCSKLVWNVLQAGGIDVGRVQTFADFGLMLRLPLPIVQNAIKARYGKTPLNLNEKVITPASIFDDEKLTSVAVGD